MIDTRKIMARESVAPWISDSVLSYGKSCARLKDAQVKDCKWWQGYTFSKGVKLLGYK